MYASLFGPELHNGLLHLVVVPVCFPSTTSATVSLGVFSEIVQFDPAWPPFAPPPAVHVQAVNSAQWSVLSAETVSDTLALLFVTPVTSLSRQTPLALSLIWV